MSPSETRCISTMLAGLLPPVKVSSGMFLLLAAVVSAVVGDGLVRRFSSGSTKILFSGSCSDGMREYVNAVTSLLRRLSTLRKAGVVEDGELSNLASLLSRLTAPPRTPFRSNDKPLAPSVCSAREFSRDIKAIPEKIEFSREIRGSAETIELSRDSGPSRNSANPLMDVSRCEGGRPKVSRSLLLLRVWSASICFAESKVCSSDGG
mmetsp:Transcript_10384/g.18066  ORF Transcript_10384/g.18066 Transcript_10384/m.18066 type:complete len:207 (+) Transcript_10384:850-1470(+)